MNPESVEVVQSVSTQLSTAALRLPLAAALGAALALRPRRKGTPDRSMPVIETQIILAIVGALIMLVVGASLARAFGIVGAANLIRYRSKIEDPKDAVVMLSALAVGLASGVGLFALAVFGTLFLVASLWVIEGFEPAPRKLLELKVRFGKAPEAARARLEAVLRRYHARLELRGQAEEEITYLVNAPGDVRLDRVTAEVAQLVGEHGGAVEWAETKVKG
jgi:uncharacterized membrane protein YhiD involved in acid resistance